MDQGRLREVALFSGLTPAQLQRIAQVADETDVPAGRALAREGDFGREFFVIESGTAEVTRQGERVATLGPGDFFGEIALVAEERRMATVTAQTDMTLIVLTRSAFRGLQHTEPAVYAQVRDAVRDRMTPA